ncbi:unnamed protein product, partial [Oikopleura dioica]
MAPQERGKEGTRCERCASSRGLIEYTQVQGHQSPIAADGKMYVTQRATSLLPLSLSLTHRAIKEITAYFCVCTTKNDGKANAGKALPRPILKSADFSSNDEEKSKSDESNKSEKKKEEETEKGGFLHNEQLITICLAALGVTSTGLLMWIAIQHLYGIYTDFKKTMAPVGYRESSYGDEFDCPEVCSVMSARMADRPPSYQHSQHHFQRENSHPADPQFSQPPLPEPAPPSPGCAGPSTSAYGNPHHRRQRSQEEVLPPLPDEQDSEWESDDFQLTTPNSLTEASSRPSRIPALRALNDQEEPVARNVIVSFC